MKFQLLLPFLCFALLACGQLQSEKHQQNLSALLGATAGSGSCVSAGAPSGISASGALAGFSACASSDPSSVVIRYNLGSSGNTYCVYPGTDGISFSTSDGRCFNTSTPNSALTITFSNSSFNSVAIIQQQNQGGFQTVGFGGISVPYVVAKFR